MKTSYMLIAFECSFPMHSVNSEAQFWYIGCSPTALLAKDRRMPVHRLQVSTIFFSSSLAKIHIQTSDWTEGFKQVHRHFFMLDSDQIPLNVMPNFPLIS